MRTTERTFAPALASAGKAETRFFASAVALIKTVLHGLRNRRAMAALYEFDDFQLNDIGLSRRDVDHARSEAGLLRDPFQHLPRSVMQRGIRHTAYRPMF